MSPGALDTPFANTKNLEFAHLGLGKLVPHCPFSIVPHNVIFLWGPPQLCRIMSPGALETLLANTKNVEFTHLGLGEPDPHCLFNIVPANVIFLFSF
jgi:hypothetical protein